MGAEQHTWAREGFSLFCNTSAIIALLSVALLGPAAAERSKGKIIGPLVASGNPNYFKDASGEVLILTGSHTWNTLQDWGSHGSPQTLDFNAFVSFLVAHGHNFTLLWATELPRVCGLPSTADLAPDLTVSPHPSQRTGPGTATDGGLKFDLTKFDQSYLIACARGPKLCAMLASTLVFIYSRVNFSARSAARATQTVKPERFKVDTSMAVLQSTALALGAPKVQGNDLYFGNTKAADVIGALVDKLGGAASIFLKSGDQYVRVATTLKKEDG
jgi:hypothetical protein